VEIGLREGDKRFGFDGNDGCISDGSRLGAGARWSQSCVWLHGGFDG
jgi:hypothetical protein